MSERLNPEQLLTQANEQLHRKLKVDTAIESERTKFESDVTARRKELEAERYNSIVNVTAKLRDAETNA